MVFIVVAQIAYAYRCSSRALAFPSPLLGKCFGLVAVEMILLSAIMQFSAAFIQSLCFKPIGFWHWEAKVAKRQCHECLRRKVCACSPNHACPHALVPPLTFFSPSVAFGTAGTQNTIKWCQDRVHCSNKVPLLPFFFLLFLSLLCVHQPLWTQVKVKEMIPQNV